MSRQDFSDRETVRNRGRKARRLEIEHLNGMRNAMSSRQGRTFMWWLLGQCGTHRSTFSPEALQMAFNGGMQNVGFLLEAKIAEACPELYLLMQQEAMKRDEPQEASEPPESQETQEEVNA